MQGRSVIMEWQPLEKLADHIIMPGIDKHLEPLLYFRGHASLGRIHRLWNFTLAAKIQGCASMSDIVKLSHNPEFSHLCGTTNPVKMVGAVGFMNRLRQSPEVTANVPELTEWCKYILPDFWTYQRVSPFSAQKRCAWWRTYSPKKIGRSRNVKQLCSADRLFYPFIAYDPRRSDGASVIEAVNLAVPHGLPEDIRADICQDMVCAILAGDLRLEDVKGGVADFVRRGRKMFANKWQFSSYDAAIPGTDELTLADILCSPEDWSFSDVE